VGAVTGDVVDLLGKPWQPKKRRRTFKRLPPKHFDSERTAVLRDLMVCLIQSEFNARDIERCWEFFLAKLAGDRM
jgi:hypothetical protein